MKAVAKKVVTDALEDKYATSGAQIGGEARYFNGAISSTTECYPILPIIQQGTDGFQRVGDKIRPKSFRLDVTICANGSISSSMLAQVRMFVLEDKGIRTLSLLAQTPIDSQLLDYGNTVGGFTGAPVQIMNRVNKKRYRAFADKTLLVFKGTNQTPNVSNGYIGNQTVVDQHQVHRLSFKIPTPAVLHYVNALDSYPSNFAPFFCLGYVQPDGTVAGIDVSNLRVGANWIAHLDYEDA